MLALYVMSVKTGGKRSSFIKLRVITFSAEVRPPPSSDTIIIFEEKAAWDCAHNFQSFIVAQSNTAGTVLIKNGLFYNRYQLSELGSSGHISVWSLQSERRQKRWKWHTEMENSWTILLEKQTFHLYSALAISNYYIIFSKTVQTLLCRSCYFLL